MLGVRQQASPPLQNLQQQQQQRHRVSFNRDVHVKRIGNGAAPPPPTDPPSRLPRPPRLSRRDAAAEARRVISAAAAAAPYATPVSAPGDPRRFHSLPTRRKQPRAGVRPPSPDRPDAAKRPRVAARSASDASRRRDAAAADADKSRFWSLDRLRTRKSKPSRTQSDTEPAPIPSILSRKSSSSDTEPAPIPSILSRKSSSSDTEPAPIPSILSRKSSSSDTEKRARRNSDSDASSVAKRTPLTPIAEAPPGVDAWRGRRDAAMHASQAPAVKAAVTRGLAVDSMVRRLSAERAGRGPPRVVSPAGLIAPGAHNKHNNNMPFSYTEPNAAFHEAGEPQRPTRSARHAAPTPPRPTPSPPAPPGPADHVIYAEVVCGGGGGSGGGGGVKRTVHTSVVQSRPVAGDAQSFDAMPPPGKEYVTQYVTRVRDESAERRGRADGTDGRRDASAFEEQRRFGEEDVIEPVLRPTLFDGSDLASRRDRLQSRIESQRRGGRRRDALDAAVIDSVRRFPSTPRLAGDASRRDFLRSQLASDAAAAGPHFARSVDHIDKFAAATPTPTPTPKGDAKFTDSGIDIAFPGAGGKVVLQEVTKSYHNTYHTQATRLVDSVDGAGADSRRRGRHYASQPTLTNITQVDDDGHIKPGSEEDDEDDVDPCYFYNQQENVDQIRARRARADAVPTSTPPAAERRDARATPRGELDEASCVLDDVEASRRLLLEERRRGVEERRGADARPEKVRTATLKKKQGPIEKVKAYFARGDARKKAAGRKEAVAAEDALTSRYSEYRGARVDAGERTPSTPPRAPTRAKAGTSAASQIESSRSSSSRRERMATPSPSPSRPNAQQNGQQNGRQNGGQTNSGSWFKSLDRLTSRKNKSKPKLDPRETISENDELKSTFKHSTNNNVDKANKNLRFFGDTDGESVRSAKPVMRTPMTTLTEHPTSTRYNESNGSAATTRYNESNGSAATTRYNESNGSAATTRYNESNGSAGTTRYVPLRDAGNRRYKSTNRLQVPRRRHHRSAGELATSSAESTTEGDSSQQSQRSVVYLHAATVGDIPGRTTASRNARRARSREELSSTTGSNLTPQKRTVSRSISVLAPWKPRHYRQPMEVHYENDSDLQARNAKPPKVPNYKTSSSTLNRINNKEKSYNSLSRGGHKDKENRRSMNSLNRKDGYQKSQDSLNIKAGSRRDLDSTAGYERNAKSRIGNGTVDSYRNGTTTLKKTKTGDGQKRADLSRSMSMPKDAKVKSGWFRLRKK